MTELVRLLQKIKSRWTLLWLGLGWIAYLYLGTLVPRIAEQHAGTRSQEAPRVTPDSTDFQNRTYIDDPNSPNVRIRDSISETNSISGVEVPASRTGASGPIGITSTGPVTIESGGAASFGQQGGITAARVEIVNPLPAERTWELSVAKCDDALLTLTAFEPITLSVGAFISNNDGNRVANILAQCFERTGWEVRLAALPVNPDGVLVGASVDDRRLALVRDALRTFGLRVTASDIRPAYGTSIDIVVGTEPIGNATSEQARP